jgi:ADP-heptose:LPS heptosyltransferase
VLNFTNFKVLTLIRAYVFNRLFHIFVEDLNMGVVRQAEILIVHQGGVGDFILCLPALGSVRQHYPGAWVELMGYPRVLQLVEGRYYVDSGRSVDEVGLGSFYMRDGDLDEVAFRYFAGFDRAFIFMSDRSGVFSANVRRTGVQEVFSIPPFPETEKAIHVIDHMLSSLSSMGIPPGLRVPKIFLCEEDRVFAEDWLRQRGAFEKGLIALHPGSGSRNKLWPMEKFLDLVARITVDLRFKIILLIGPAEREYLGSQLELMRSSNPIWAENLSLIHVASLLDRCRCYIGADSGITHLAAAVGIPTIALFGPTDPRIWGPRGERVAILEKNVSCSPCTPEDIERCGHRGCLDLIGVDEVMEKACAFLCSPGVV